MRNKHRNYVIKIREDSISFIYYTSPLTMPRCPEIGAIFFVVPLFCGVMTTFYFDLPRVLGQDSMAANIFCFLGVTAVWSAGLWVASKETSWYRLTFSKTGRQVALYERLPLKVKTESSYDIFDLCIKMSPEELHLRWRYVDDDDWVASFTWAIPGRQLAKLNTALRQSGVSILSGAELRLLDENP